MSSDQNVVSAGTVPISPAAHLHDAVQLETSKCLVDVEKQDAGCSVGEILNVSLSGATGNATIVLSGKRQFDHQSQNFCMSYFKSLGMDAGVLHIVAMNPDASRAL